MEITLSADFNQQVEAELSRGHYPSTDAPIEQAVRQFLEERQRADRRLDSIRRIGLAVDQAGLYESVLIPSQE